MLCYKEVPVNKKTKKTSIIIKKESNLYKLEKELRRRIYGKN